MVTLINIELLVVVMLTTPNNKQRNVISTYNRSPFFSFLFRHAYWGVEGGGGGGGGGCNRAFYIIAPLRQSLQ